MDGSVWEGVTIWTFLSPLGLFIVVFIVGSIAEGGPRELIRLWTMTRDEAPVLYRDERHCEACGRRHRPADVC